MAYKIEKRSSTAPSSDSAIDFNERVYTLPLCGCSNFTDEVSVGDIIGVKLSANVRVRIRFSTSSIFLPEEKMYLLPEQFGSYRPVEEHLFRVTKINKPSKYEVVPYYLDGNKVIVKEIEETFETEGQIPVNEIEPNELCEELFLNKTLKRFKIDQEYDIFSKYKVDRLFTLLDTYDEANRDTFTVHSVRKLLPLQNYAKTVFDLKEEGASMQKFYTQLAKYGPVLLNIFGQDSNILSELGTYDLAVAHMDALYSSALALINSDTVPDMLTHRLHIPSRLAAPSIHHAIHRVKYNEIFRVYRADPAYVLCRTKYVSNWSGIIIDNAIRGHITDGNVVRVLFGKNKEASKDDKYEYSSVIYCRVLQRLNETQCLACIENYYCSEYEDIVFVLNVNAISEIPFTWAGNENLVETNLDLDRGEGFSVTGGPAAVMSTADGEAVTSDDGGQLEQEVYPLEYTVLLR